jgi:hypothetical protein
MGQYPSGGEKMNRLPAAPVAAAIVLAAGCGGATAAHTAATHETTTTATAKTQPSGGATGTTAVDVTGADQMRGYFRHVAAVRRQLVIARRSTRALTAAIRARDGDAAGAAARNAAAGVRKALAIAKRITPREPLRTIHRDLLANLRIGVVYLNRMAADLESRDVSRIRRWPKTVVPDIRRSERLYAEWAASSAAFASTFGIRPPHWVHTMDRWN